MAAPLRSPPPPEWSHEAELVVKDVIREFEALDEEIVNQEVKEPEEAKEVAERLESIRSRLCALPADDVTRVSVYHLAHSSYNRWEKALALYRIA